MEQLAYKNEKKKDPMNRAACFWGQMLISDDSAWATRRRFST